MQPSKLIVFSFRFRNISIKELFEINEGSLVMKSDVGVPLRSKREIHQCTKLGGYLFKK